MQNRPEPATPDARPSRRPGAPAWGAERGLVWIVDDSPLDVEMARRALAGIYDIETFPDGATMLERVASAGGPDTLVLDCQLPGMSGVDVCRFLRGSLDEVALPVVMLTVQGHKQDVVEGLAAGANDYVTKPYDAAELLARVGTLVYTKRLYERAHRAERALEIERDQLREREAQIQALVDGSPVAIGFLDRELSYLRVNEALVTAYRASGARAPAFGERVSGSPTELERAFRGVLDTGESVTNLDVRVGASAAGGGGGDYLASYFPVRVSGQTVGLAVMATEITQRRRAERALDLLARAGTVLHMALDSVARCQSIVQLVVPELADACGVFMCQRDGALALVAGAPIDPGRSSVLGDLSRSTQVLAGRATSEGPQAVRPLLVPDVAAALAAARAGAPGDVAPLTALRDAGVTSYLLAPLALQDRAVGCLALASAGSGRRYDEADLALAQELGRRTAGAVDNARLFEMTQIERARADEANRAKDEFLAIVSHELRSPLTAILGWASLLATGDLAPEDRVRAVQTIERNARSQTQLIADLLNISSILSGKLRLDVTRVQPGPIVESGLETIRPTAEAKGVGVFPFVDTQAGLIQGDPDRLQQIVWNLLTNAVKFTPRGGRVEVRVQRAGTDVEILVSDSGCGIPEDFLPHVFERFRQAETGVARQHAGLGLGLAITRHLVELHGGTIRAMSQGSGMGATFVVRFPLAPLGASPSPPAPAPPPGVLAPPLHTLPELRGVRLLVVDDEPDVRAFITSALRGCQAEVTVAAGVADAMAAFRASPPDIVLSDIGMPGKSGYDLIRMIRELPPEQGGRTAAVALTGYNRLDDRTRALMMGFDMHIAKPIEAAELLVVLARLASRIRQA